MNHQLKIIKFGGGILDEPELLQRGLNDFAAISGPKLLVHGGGSRANQLCKQLNIPVRMHHGRRLTDAPTLEVVTMVYAGLINTRLTAQLQALHCNAIGLNGADAGLITSRKRSMGEVDYGYAGDVESIDTEQLIAFIEQGLVPVCCAITHDGNGQLLNTNADTVATEIAMALSANFEVALHCCGTLPGVLMDVNNANSCLPTLTSAKRDRLVAAGIIHTGMLPKLENAFRAKRLGVSTVTIGDVQHWTSGGGTIILTKPVATCS